MSACTFLHLGNVYCAAGWVGVSGSQREFNAKQMGNRAVSLAVSDTVTETLLTVCYPFHLVLISRRTLSCTPEADVCNNDNQEAHEAN